MDRSRQMPNSNEQQSSSDDLIAELARLMAEEAQGANPAATPAPAVDKNADTSTVVKIPSARPASVNPAPAAGSAWGRHDDSLTPANTDRPSERSEPRSMPAEPRTFSPFGLDVEAGSKRNATDPERSVADTGYVREDALDRLDFGMSETNIGEAVNAKSEYSGLFAQSESGQATAESAPELQAESDALADDPIAELIAQQEREEARKSQYAGMPRHVFPDPVPAARPAPATPRASDPASTTAATEPAPAPVSVHAEPDEHSVPSVDPDVLSLLRSMSAEGAPRTPRAPAKPTVRADDTFSFPIFGTEPAKPARAAPAADPLEEIESLIGDAVRLSRDDKPQARKPVEPLADLDDAAHRAEAAIAAATAASGRTGHRMQQPELHDPLMDSDGEIVDAVPELERDEVKPVKPRSGRLVIGAAAATILVAVGLGLFWVFGETGITDGSVPFLASNTGDAKAPVAQNTTSSETSQPAIFNEMDGNGAQTPADEQIVSRDQSAAASTTAPADAATDTATNLASAGDTEASTGIRQVETPQAAEESLANRKVRTVTVRPDGTIVSNEDTLAANEVLPVVRPNVPALSGDTAAVTDFQVATTPDTTANTDVASMAPVATDAADPLASLVSTSVAESDAAGGINTATAGAELVTDAPYPAAAPSAAFRVASAAAGTQVRAATSGATATPTNTIDLISDAANQAASQLPAATVSAPATAPQAPVATATPAVTAPFVTGPAGPDASAYVQLSSQRSLDAANVTLSSLGEKYRGLFNGAEPFIKQVDLGDRGIYYRVLVPANSLADASGVCSSVKSAGGDCFVRNNN